MTTPAAGQLGFKTTPAVDSLAPGGDDEVTGTGGNIASRAVIKSSQKTAANTATDIVSGTSTKDITDITKGIQTGQKTASA